MTKEQIEACEKLAEEYRLSVIKEFNDEDYALKKYIGFKDAIAHLCAIEDEINEDNIVNILKQRLNKKSKESEMIGEEVIAIRKFPDGEEWIKKGKLVGFVSSSLSETRYLETGAIAIILNSRGFFSEAPLHLVCLASKAPKEYLEKAKLIERDDVV